MVWLNTAKSLGTLQEVLEMTTTRSPMMTTHNTLHKLRKNRFFRARGMPTKKTKVPSPKLQLLVVPSTIIVDFDSDSNVITSSEPHFIFLLWIRIQLLCQKATTVYIKLRHSLIGSFRENGICYY